MIRKNFKQLMLIALLFVGSASVAEEYLNGNAVLNKGDVNCAIKEVDDNGLEFNLKENSLLEWEKLNTNSNQYLNFNLNGNSMINKVTGGQASSFAGTINTDGTGKLIIANPSGVLFHNGSVINASGTDMVITTKNASFGKNNSIEFKNNNGKGHIDFNSQHAKIGNLILIGSEDVILNRANITTKSLRMYTRDGITYKLSSDNQVKKFSNGKSSSRTSGQTSIVHSTINGDITDVNAQSNIRFSNSKINGNISSLTTKTGNIEINENTGICGINDLLTINGQIRIFNNEIKNNINRITSNANTLIFGNTLSGKIFNITSNNGMIQINDNKGTIKTISNLNAKNGQVRIFKNTIENINDINAKNDNIIFANTINGSISNIHSKNGKAQINDNYQGVISKISNVSGPRVGIFDNYVKGSIKNTKGSRVDIYNNKYQPVITPLVPLTPAIKPTPKPEPQKKNANLDTASYDFMKTNRVPADVNAKFTPKQFTPKAFAASDESSISVNKQNTLLSAKQGKNNTIIIQKTFRAE